MNNSLIKFVIYCISIVCIWLPTHAQQLQLDGVYRGRNVFIQNPYNNATGIYCVSSVHVNGKLALSNPNSSALTVDLSAFSINDKIDLVIFHNSNCIPKILNPRVLQPGSGFSIVQTSVDNASVSWITTGEQDKAAYFELEKRKLDGWEVIQKVKAKGDIDNNQYSLGVVHYAGDNEFRIHYESRIQSMYSEIFNFYSTDQPISFFPTEDVDELISLSKITDYIIKDIDGKVYKKGVGEDIFVSDLRPGEYILVIENREELFYKPEPEED